MHFTRPSKHTYRFLFIVLILLLTGVVTERLTTLEFDSSLAPLELTDATTTTLTALPAEILPPPKPVLPPLNTAQYDSMLLTNAHGDTTGLWPVKTEYPANGALLPFNRIVAYYGNFYSTKMGALGEYPEDEMLARLDKEVKVWQAADPSTPVIPGIHYIAVTAQAAPGWDGKYRARMPFTQIDKAVTIANKISGVVFLDIQPGLSTVQAEVPALDTYLKMPNVHLGIDPEFYMKTGKTPGSVIGSIDAADINFVTEHLANIVRENNLPPKILIIHRFTQGMVKNYQNIQTRPEVQIVIDFDGWGHKANKINAYTDFVYSEPIQFTGFKLFYKNDIRKTGSVMLTPEEVLALTPSPLYIQYQ